MSFVGTDVILQVNNRNDDPFNACAAYQPVRRSWDSAQHKLFDDLCGPFQVESKLPPATCNGLHGKRRVLFQVCCW